jgi:anti-sigma factor RsiW
MNLNSSCNNLDAYLSDALSDDERALFDSHLQGCATCRGAVDQQQWIDDILQSPERIQLERPSVIILDTFRVSVARRRRRFIQVACSLAVAATLLIAVGLVKLNRQANGLSKSEEPAVAVAEPGHVPTPAQPPATFFSSSDAIVVPLESPSADVTVVQVYPTIDTERRSRLELTLTNTSTKPNGG